MIAAGLVALIGVAAFLIWREAQLDRRAEQVDAQAVALRENAAAVFGQTLARANFVRGAVEASGRPEMLDDAFALTVAWGPSAGAAVVDVRPDGKPRVLRRTGRTRLLAETLAMSLPVPEDQPVLMTGRRLEGRVLIAHASRRGDRIVYHESALGPRVLQSLAQGHEAIDFEIVATPVSGTELVIVPHPPDLRMGDPTKSQEISGLGAPTELRTRPAASLPPAVGNTAAAMWELAIVLSTLAAALGVGLHYYRKRGLLRRSARERELLYIANHDQVTGLPNRAALYDHLEHHGDGQISLLFIYLDGLETVNDSYGHEAADRLLAIVAQRLRDNIRKPDQVFRLGDDEFIVVSRSWAVEALKTRAQQVLDIPVELTDGYVTVDASVGAMSIMSGDDFDARDALRAANEAMRKEKTLRKALDTLDQAGEI